MLDDIYCNFIPICIRGDLLTMKSLKPKLLMSSFFAPCLADLHFKSNLYGQKHLFQTERILFYVYA